MVMTRPMLAVNAFLYGATLVRNKRLTAISMGSGKGQPILGSET